MATSGELIKVTSEVLGTPETTVATYYRSLREAGLVTKAGRGPRSAAKMTTRDAARLLMACGGARFEREPAASVVQDYLRLRSSHSARWLGPDKGWLTNNDGVWTLPSYPVPQLLALPAHHGFDDALTALVEAVIAREGPFKGTYRIEVDFGGPAPAVGIKLEFFSSYWEPIAEELEETGYHLLDDPKAYALSREVDLKLHREFGERTILAVAKLLRGDG